jgi:hypothetical protein
MRVDTNMDLFLMVGEMPSPPCEHPQHTIKHKDQPATYYFTAHCPYCEYRRECFAVCDDIMSNYRNDVPIFCAGCKTVDGGQTFWIVLGKI